MSTRPSRRQCACATDPTRCARELGSLFAEHNTLVRRFIGRRVSRPDLVDDIASEVWTAALVTIRKGRRSEVTQAWLVTVARRRLADHWRQVGADRRRFDRLVGELGQRVDVSPLDTLLAVDESILALTQTANAGVLRLRYIEGWTVSEIADQLGISYQAAESRLARARRSLRAELSNRPEAIAA